MPGLAGSVTALGLLGVASLASPAYFEAKAVTDSWSLSITDDVTVAATAGAVDTWSLSVADSAIAADTTPPVAQGVSDTWSLGWSDATPVVSIFPKQITDRSLRAVAGPWIDIAAKPFVGTNAVAAIDTWSLSWTEEPTSQLTIDTWDTWRLGWTEQPLSISVSQTFALNDLWSLNWLDVSSIFFGGPLEQNLVDTWSLSLTDSATVAATADAVDTWSLTITDAASVAVTQDALSAADTWSLAYSLESGFVGVVSDIPILASDEWRLVFADASNVSFVLTAASARRVVRVRPRNRTVRVK